MIRNQLRKKFTKSLVFLTPILLSVMLTPFAAWAEDIVLGMSAAFKGSSKALGIELYRGSMAYIQEINRRGGIDGKKIVIKAYDDGYDPIPTIKNTIQLIENDDVLVLFNYVGTPTVTRMLPLLTRYSDRNVYLFFPFTGAQPHRQEPYRDYVFNFRASYRQETKGLVENLIEIGRKRIAVFYQADAYGRSGWDGVRRELAEYGLPIVAEATYRRGITESQSLKPQVDILRSANPDAIISIGTYAASAAFIRDARDAGLDVPIANISFVGSESLLNLLQEMGQGNGKNYTTNLINSQVVPSYEDTSLPAVREYRRLMEENNPALPDHLKSNDYKPLPYSFVSFEGFLNAKLMVTILQRMTGETVEVLEMGARGEKVTQLQQRLEGKGFSPGTIDGVFGRKTYDAVKDFQRSLGIKTDGRVDAKTRAALFEIEIHQGLSLDNKERIREMAQSITNLDLGINAPVSFNADNHQGLDSVYYTTIENGRFVPLRNWQRWAK